MRDFFNTLFDNGQSTCFTYSPYGTFTKLVSDFISQPDRSQYFCINALSELDVNFANSNSKNAALNKGRRASSNVICYRNFLIECDGIDLDSQIKHIKESGIPFSTAVFSGSKSIHLIVSLENPVATMAEYKTMWLRIAAAFNGLHNYADSSTSDCARLSRIPNALRDNGNIQELLKVTKRISDETIYSWLKSRRLSDLSKAILAQDRKSKMPKVKKGFTTIKFKSKDTLNLIEKGIITTTSRHDSLTKAVVQLYKSHHTIEEIEALLTDVAADLIPERNDLPALIKWVEQNIEQDDVEG